MVNCFNLNFII